MVTLHAYVLRELLKTLGLTVTALTVLVTMGGGLYNVVRSEGVSPGDVIQFLPLLIPIVITLTLPMATLFSATMVYGRLAADNELVACRAAGINIHRLFLSAILLSVFVAAFSLLFGNFIAPGFANRIGQSARNNLRDMVAQHLQHEGFIHHRRKSVEGRYTLQKDEGEQYTLTAERVQGVSDEALREKGFETGDGLQYLLITNPTFLHVDAGGKLIRFTVAECGLCMFDTRPTSVELTIFVHKGRDFEIGKRAVYIGQQQIGPIAVPVPTLFRLSMADLRSLLEWRAAPWEIPRLRDKVDDLLSGLTRQLFHTDCAERLEQGQAVRLSDGRGREYTLTADSVRDDGKGLTLTHGRVELRYVTETLPTVYEAERIELRARPLPGGQIPVEINLVRTLDHDVLEYDPRAAADSEPRRRPTLSLDGAVVPAEFIQRMQQYTPAAVLDPNVALPIDDRLADKRLSLQNAVQQMRHKIGATIHFRLAYSSSVLVTVLMGAALGIVFRGARALAAFALALIPFFSVMILMVLGKQLSEEAATVAIGPFVTWGGLALVLAADLVILRLGVRR